MEYESDEENDPLVQATGGDKIDSEAELASQKVMIAATVGKAHYGDLTGRRVLGSIPSAWGSAKPTARLTWDGWGTWSLDRASRGACGLRWAATRCTPPSLAPTHVVLPSALLAFPHSWSWWEGGIHCNSSLEIVEVVEQLWELPECRVDGSARSGTL